MITTDDDGWLWVMCPCGYTQGPFPGRADAETDAEEHEDDCLR